MYSSTDLRILFPTSFSGACFRTARFISQLADTCRVDLTIAHVAQPGTVSAQTQRELDSFLAETDSYDRCRRVLVEGEDVAKSIVSLFGKDRYDLIMAPSSDRPGIANVFSPSLRARLLKYCNAPLWTSGAVVNKQGKAELKTIACLVDFNTDTETYLPTVASLASRMGARLCVLHVVPPVDEGTLVSSLRSKAPLMPEVAMERLRSLFAGQSTPEIDVTLGHVSGELPRMLRRWDADLLFVGRAQALRGSWMPRLARHINRMPCPVICADGASADFTRWSFQDEPATETQALVRTGSQLFAH